ncbi:MAG: hypothetical protein QY326_07195 [Bdellovibrionota bacterium]|nr:MAG: hypothetical protein QY326_07195 [Bdellovibrionota bacterium]
MTSKLHTFLSALSCEQYTRLLSRSLDSKLSFSERLSFYTHHILCVVCRRYRRQILLIERMAQKVAGADYAKDKQERAGSAGGELSAEARERIESELSRELATRCNKPNG